MPFSYVCETCGTSFTRDRRAGPRNPYRFCSKACSGAARTAEALERFWDRVAVGDSAACWPWTGPVYPNGYGEPGVREHRSAHRAAWALTHGAIPPGMMVCHACDNRLCCNPTHLFLGTAADNQEDMARKARSLHGHRHVRSKLTREQVAEIRSGSSTSQRALARRFGVSKRTIQKVLLGISYIHS